RGPDVAPMLPADGRAQQPAMFQGWPANPEAVFLLSAQMHGYMLPCGCSDPQVGGLERRYNLLQNLKDRGWPVLPLDLGDLAQKAGPVTLPTLQGPIKLAYPRKALETLGYQAASFGEYEASLSLIDVFSNWPLQELKPPLVAANLTEPKDFKEFVK